MLSKHLEMLWPKILRSCSYKWQYLLREHLSHEPPRNWKMGNSSSWVRQQNSGRIISNQSCQNNIFCFTSSSTKPLEFGVICGAVAWNPFKWKGHGWLGCLWSCPSPFGKTIWWSICLLCKRLEEFGNNSNISVLPMLFPVNSKQHCTSC